MNVQEFYDYITEHLTPEEALKKLLESSLINYEKLKFDKGKEVHPLFILSMAAMDMGWGITIESDNKNIEGLITGNKEYMKRNLKETE